MEKASKLEIRFSDLWSVFKRCWWIMLLAAAIIFAAVYIIESVTYEEEYTATAIVWALGNNASTTAGTSTSDVSIGTQLINDYKQLMTTDDLLQEVIDKEVLNMRPAELRDAITISHKDETRVMRVSVTTGKATGSSKIVNTLVNVFCDRVNSKNVANANPNGNTTTRPQQNLITVWAEATTPKAPSNAISALRIAIIAFVVAVLVYVLYFILYIMDDKISTAEDVEKYLGVSMLGSIPNRQDMIRRKKGKGAYYGYYGGGSQESKEQ